MCNLTVQFWLHLLIKPLLIATPVVGKNLSKILQKRYVK